MQQHQQRSKRPSAIPSWAPSEAWVYVCFIHLVRQRALGDSPSFWALLPRPGAVSTSLESIPYTPITPFISSLAETTRKLHRSVSPWFVPCFWLYCLSLPFDAYDNAYLANYPRPGLYDRCG